MLRFASAPTFAPLMAARLSLGGVAVGASEIRVGCTAGDDGGWDGKVRHASGRAGTTGVSCFLAQARGDANGSREEPHSCGSLPTRRVGCTAGDDGGWDGKVRHASGRAGTTGVSCFLAQARGDANGHQGRTTLLWFCADWMNVGKTQGKPSALRGNCRSWLTRRPIAETFAAQRLSFFVLS